MPFLSRWCFLTLDNGWKALITCRSNLFRISCNQMFVEYAHEDLADLVARQHGRLRMHNGYIRNLRSKRVHLVCSALLCSLKNKPRRNFRIFDTICGFASYYEEWFSPTNYRIWRVPWFVEMKKSSAFNWWGKLVNSKVSFYEKTCKKSQIYGVEGFWVHGIRQDCSHTIDKNPKQFFGSFSLFSWPLKTTGTIRHLVHDRRKTSLSYQGYWTTAKL